MENIEKYILLRDSFVKKKKDLRDRIEEHRNGLMEHQSEIVRLNNEIKNSRPKIDDPLIDGTLICKNCDIYSMRFKGKIPGQGDTQTIYECVVCNYSYYTI